MFGDNRKLFGLSCDHDGDLPIRETARLGGGCRRNPANPPEHTVINENRPIPERAGSLNQVRGARSQDHAHGCQSHEVKVWGQAHHQLSDNLYQLAPTPTYVMPRLDRGIQTLAG
jgi:hypothetical protein